MGALTGAQRPASVEALWTLGSAVPRVGLVGGASGSEGRHKDPVAKETASLALRELGTSLRGLGRLRGAVLAGEPGKGGERARRFSP